MAVRRRKEIVLVGARGQAKDLIGLLEDDGRFRIVCLIDEIAETRLLGHEVVRPEAYDGGCRDALLAIGLPDGKVAVLAQYERFAFRWQSYVDRRAFVSPHAELGAGCIVAPFAMLAGDVRLGAHVYVAAFAGAGHDSTIGDLSSLLPYSGLGGGSRIGARCTLGAGAHLLPGITIGDDVVVTVRRHRDARSARPGEGRRFAGAHRGEVLRGDDATPLHPVLRPAAPVPPADWPTAWSRLTRPGRLINIIAIYPEEAYRLPILERHFRGRRHLLVNHPDGVGRVLQHNAANYVKGRKLQRVLKPIMGQSLLTTEGADWQRQRAIMAPAFRHASIMTFVPLFAAKAEAWRARWEASGRAGTGRHGGGDAAADAVGLRRRHARRRDRAARGGSRHARSLSSPCPDGRGADHARPAGAASASRSATGSPGSPPVLSGRSPRHCGRRP